MDEIIGIDHIGVRVKNLAQARAFYEQLGFDFLIGPIGPEPVAVMEHPSGVNLNLILNAHPVSEKNILMDIPEKHTGYTHIALKINNIAKIQAALEKMNIKITGGPITFPGGGTSLFVRDPDSNVIEFHQPVQPADA